MLYQRQAAVCDAGPALDQHRDMVSCSLRYVFTYILLPQNQKVLKHHRNNGNLLKLIRGLWGLLYTSHSIQRHIVTLVLKGVSATLYVADTTL